MLVEKLEEIVNGFDWAFHYGADHWQNLGDFPDDADVPFDERKKYFQFLWKSATDILNSYGATEGVTYDGQFVLSVRSRVSDPTYEFKYETHIKGLEAELDRLKSEITDCDGLTLKFWKSDEVENLYDANMDGLKVTFKIEWYG